MSTDPYPEITGDESGLVPPQAGRPPQWPKKIRTLSTTELDRLTIDGTGRFYWDGQLVNYEPPGPKKFDETSSDSQERLAMELLDRAAHELIDPKFPKPVEGAELQKPAEPNAHRDVHGTIDLDKVRPANEAQMAAAMAELSGAANMLPIAGRVSLRLSFVQSLGAIIMILAIAVGATGVAVRGLVAAHEWGCRTALIQSYCPAPPPAPRPPPRPDIPA